jgi:CCR4-NOT transcription complex subunit 1
MSLGEDIKDALESLSERFNKGSEDEIKKFFYFTLKYATEKVLESQSPYCDSLDYRYIDEYSKLIIVFLKIVSTNRSVYLEHVCEAIILIINKFHETDSQPFNQRPFFKLILNLIYDVSRTSYGFDTSTILTMYTVFTQLLHKLQPLSYPGFSFAWLELVSNRYFMPAILDKEGYWDLYHELLIDVLKFAQVKLTFEALNTEESMRVYYKGLLRVIMMLLHDFPDFLS